METASIPFVDVYHGIHEDVTISWDVVVTKLSGLDRWRFLVLVDGLRRQDGTAIRGGMLKVFVQLKYAGFWSMWDARQGLVSSTPWRASQVQATPIRASAAENGEVSVFFSASTTDKVGKGFYFATVVPIPGAPDYRVKDDPNQLEYRI